MNDPPRKATEFEVPLRATQPNRTQEVENAYFAAHGYCSIDWLAGIQQEAVELHESFVQAKAAIEAAGGTLVKRSSRPIEGPGDVAKAIENNRRIVLSIAAWASSHRRTAPRRAAPRRIGARRHRRAATRSPAASSDDGCSDPDLEPPRAARAALPAAAPSPLPSDSKPDLIVAAAAVALALAALVAGYLLAGQVALLLPALAGVALLTEQEAAERLKCSVPLVRKLRARGLLAWVKVGKSPRFTEAQLDDFIDAQTRAARGPVRVVRGAR